MLSKHDPSTGGEVRNGAYRRTLRLPSGYGIVSLTPRTDHVGCELFLDDLRDLPTATARCRRRLDLDANPAAAQDILSHDPHLTDLITKSPGQRIPRTVDESELALRVVIGQQISVKAARTHAGRIARAYGTPIEDPNGALTHVFPTVGQLAQINLAYLAFPKSRQRTFVALIRGPADGDVVLGPSCDWRHARRQLLAVPGIGPWTVELIAMRGLGDPDAFPATDLGVLTAARSLGLPVDARALIAHSTQWRPWRAYAMQYLWTALQHEVNEWPPKVTVENK